MKPAPPDPIEVTPRLWHGFGNPDGVAWDIGANCGQTLPILTRRFKYVVAFEPAVECRPWLDKWTDRAEVFEYAISSFDGHVDLLAVDDKIDTGQLVDQLIVDMEWSPTAGRIRRVPCYSVDTLMRNGFPAPDFLKIDTEGHELQILTGAEETIAEYMPALLVEFHSKDLYAACVECLTRHGYKVSTVRHPHYPKDSDMYHQHGWIRALPL